MTDEELTAEHDKQWKDFYESVADVLKDCRHQLSTAANLIPTFPETGDLAEASRAEALVKAAETSSPGASRDKGRTIKIPIRSMIQSSLAEAAMLLNVHLRLHETRTGSWPDDKTLKQIAARFPGMRIERVGKDLKIDAAADHPVRRLVDHKLLILPQTLEPWAS